MATGDYIIPEDIRSSLNPEQLSIIDEFDSEYGVGNEASFQMAQDFLQFASEAPPQTKPTEEPSERTPRQFRAPVSEADLSSLEANVLNTMVKDIQLNEGLDYIEAEQEAIKRINAKRESYLEGKTIEGDVVSASSEDEIREADSAYSAFLKSLGPQTIKLSRQERVAESGISDSEINRLREYVIIESKAEARERAKKRGFLPEEDLELFMEVEKEEQAPLMKDKLQSLAVDWYNNAKKNVLEENGLDPEGDFPSGEQGQRLKDEAKNRADAVYNYITPLAFWDLGEVKVDNERLVPGAKGDYESRLYKRVAKKDSWTDLDIGDLAGAAFYSNWHDYDPDTGAVSETWLSAAIRDINLIPRAITYPIIRATTWDMNPDTGEAYDKSDPMYKLSRWQEKQLESGNFLEQGGAWLSGLFLGHGYNIDESMYTGSILRDFALSHGQGHTSGSDVGFLQATRTAQNAGVLPDSWDEVTGLMIDVAAPLKVATAPFKASKVLTGATAKRVRDMAEAMSFEKVADVAEATRVWASSTESLSDAIVLNRAFRDIAEDLGEVPKKRRLRGAVEAPDKITDSMAAVLARKLVTVDKYEDLEKVFPNLKRGDALHGIINDAFTTLEDFRRLGKLKGNAFKKSVDSLRQFRRGKQLVASLEAAAGLKPMRTRDVKLASMPKNTSKALGVKVLQNTIKNDVRKLVANHIPNDFVFATDRIIVRRGVWLKNQDKINEAITKVKQFDIINENGKGLYKFKNPKETAKLARSSFKDTDLSPAVNKAIDKVEDGIPLTRQEFTIIGGLVDDAVVLDKIPVGGFAVKDPMDLAYERARPLSQGRAFTSARYMQDLAKGARAFLNGTSDYRAVVANPTKKKLFRPKAEVFNADTPKAVLEWDYKTRFELNQAGKTYEKLLLNAMSRGDDDAVTNILNRLSVSDEAVGLTKEDSVGAYLDLVNILYKPGKSLSNFYNNTTLKDMIAKSISENPSVFKTVDGKPLISADGFNIVVDNLRRSLSPTDLALLENTALKTRKFSSIGVTDTTDLGAAMTAYGVFRVSNKILDRAHKELTEMFPSLYLNVPTPINAAEVSARVEMFRDIAKVSGVSDDVIRKTAGSVRSALETNRSHRASITRALVGHMYREGNIANLSEFDRLYEATRGTVAGVIGTSSKLNLFDDPSIQALRKAIKKIDPDNVEEIMRNVVPAYLKAVSDIDMTTIRSHFSATNVRLNAGKPHFVPVDLNPVDFGDGISMFDSRLEKLATNLGNASKRQNITAAVDTLRPSERKAWDWLQETYQMTRRTTITGILGGFPLPGLRFLGTNALTNPFIVAITAPQYSAQVALKTPSGIGQSFLRAFKRTGMIKEKQIFDPLTFLYSGDDNAILFTTAKNVPYSKADFLEAVRRNNINFSQATFEYQFDMFQDSMRLSKLGPNGKPVRSLVSVPGVSDPPSMGTFWEFLRPDKRNVWSMVAEEMDNFQRQTVFAAALKSGMREADAAALARSSLLDYGNMPGFVRSASKYMAFTAFRYNMAVETLSAFLRDGRALNNIARQMNFINVQRKSMEEWVLEPDWMKTRFWKLYGKEFDEWSVAALGPDIPIGSSLGMFANIGSMIFDPKLSEYMGTSGIVKTTASQLLSDPRLSKLFDLMFLEGDTKNVSGYMPIEYLSVFDSFGAADSLIDFFECSIVPEDRIRPDIGTYKGNQYSFTSKGREKFALYQLGLMMTGLERGVRDYPRMLASNGIVPPNIEYRKEAEGGVMFSFGGSIASVKNPAFVMDDIRRDYLRFLKSKLRSKSF